MLLFRCKMKKVMYYVSFLYLFYCCCFLNLFLFFITLIINIVIDLKKGGGGNNATLLGDFDLEPSQNSIFLQTDFADFNFKPV